MASRHAEFNWITYLDKKCENHRTTLVHDAPMMTKGYKCETLPSLTDGKMSMLNLSGSPAGINV